MSTLIPKFDLKNGGSTPVGAINRPINEKLSDSISVKDFGAVGDGVTDDTVAIQAALDTCVIGTTAQTIYFPPGVYLTGELNIIGYVNNSLGELSLTIMGYGATLKAKPANTVIIKTVTSNTQWANGMRIFGLQFDMQAMANNASYAGLLIGNFYNCTFSDLVFRGEPNSAAGIKIYDRAYTSSFNNCVFTRLRINGTALTDRVTTLAFFNCNFVQAIVDQAQIIKFYSCVVQGTLDKFVLSNCGNISMFNGDYEGNSVYLQLNAPGVNGVAGISSVGNDITTPSTYIEGVARGSRYEDRIGNVIAASIYGKPTTQYTGGGAYEIFSFIGDPLEGTNTGSKAVILVSGDNGLAGFSDLLILAYGIVIVVSSNDVYGSPPTRAYTTAGVAFLYVTLSVSTAFNIQTMVMNNPVS